MSAFRSEDVFEHATRRCLRCVGAAYLWLALMLSGCGDAKVASNPMDSTLSEIPSTAREVPAEPIAVAGRSSVVDDQPEISPTGTFSSLPSAEASTVIGGRESDEPPVVTAVDDANQDSGALSNSLMTPQFETPESSNSSPLRNVASHQPDKPPQEWLQFRGSDGQGHAAASGLPLRWSERKNIAWKVPIRGHAWSSPVIAFDRIWLTTAVLSEKSLRAICLDVTTGKTIHDVEVFRVPVFGGIHSKNSHATPTPVLIDDRCLVHFGSHGTAFLDGQGKILWKTKIEYFHHHGPAGSPAIADGAAIMACDGMTFSFYDDRKIANLPHPQFVIALELATGDVRWKSPREGTHSYVTPLVIDVDGQSQVVSPGGNKVVAYDPQTGEEIWSCRYQGYSVVPRPVYGHGLVFVCTGYDSPSLLAIRPNGRGDVTESHIVWSASKSVPLMSSPVLVGDELYMVSNQGVVSCLDARTGKLHWRNRIGGNHSSSPIFADGRLYFLDESGTTHILQPGLKFKVLAKNTLPGRTQASLAISGRAIFLRNETHLYRIEEADPKSADTTVPDSGKDSDTVKQQGDDTNAKPAE